MVADHVSENTLYCTCIADVMGSNPIVATCIFQVSIRDNYLKCAEKCEDRFSLSSTARTSNIYISFFNELCR